MIDTFRPANAQPASLTWRTPVAVEAIECTNRWLEKQIDAKIDSALRLRERDKRVRQVVTVPL